MKLKHVQYRSTHRSHANLLFFNALVTAAAGLDSASKLVLVVAMVLHKSGRDTSAKVGVTRNFVVFDGELHPPSVTQDRCYTV